MTTSTSPPHDQNTSWSSSAEHLSHDQTQQGKDDERERKEEKLPKDDHNDEETWKDDREVKLKWLKRMKGSETA